LKVDFIYKKNPIWKRCVKSCKAGSVVDLAPLIASALTSRTSMWTGSNKVIFEQQPDKRMLAVQGLMHMWFVCHGYDVKGVSAVHKLTNIVTLEDSTKTYKGRKKTGIVHASELVPTNETYNLLGPKSHKIIINKNTLENKEKREIIINAIRQALIETNQASQMDNIYILKDLSILVASDDWSDNHELL
jgi:hypothetical protein